MTRTTKQSHQRFTIFHHLNGAVTTSNSRSRLSKVSSRVDQRHSSARKNQRLAHDAHSVHFLATS